VRVAERLGVSEAIRRQTELGALLHDIGKIHIPDAIINKPGKLDAQEWAIMKTHTILGQEMLDRVGGLLTTVGLVVRASHERYDGDGYPDGLAGEAIPLGARIVAACDAFNAMTTTRSYRKALPVSDAVEELLRCSGTQFDPAVVDALLTVVGDPGWTLTVRETPVVAVAARVQA
jgi:HD-GYP domain-containing protein (c-di-GMP phosphodiesterase class II)